MLKSRDILHVALVAVVLLFLSACEKKEQKSDTPGMKCGAGKCGANMFDGNAALAKKKANILRQMRDNDPRELCVKQAKSTKEAYDCVREPDGKKLTMKCGEGKCGSAKQAAQKSMKCGEGKCGASMTQPKPKPKPKPAMKCGAGKCGSGM